MKKNAKPMNAISKAASKGLDCCYLYDSLHASAERELKRAGFKVTTVSDPRDGSVTVTISW